MLIEKKSSRTVLIVFLIVSFILTAGNGLAQSNDKMKITYASFLDFLMDLPIAIEMGYFNDLGLELEALDIASSPTRNGLLPKQDINGAFLPSQTALFYAEKGIHMVMVCGIGNRTFDFAVRSDSPIQNISDFEGKTIASVHNPSNPRLALDYDMDQAGVKANVIATKSAADRLSMLMSGKVDVIMSAPSTEARLGDGIRIVHSCSTSKYLWNSCGWWFKPDYIKAHPEAIEKFVKGLSMAREMIINDPKKAIKVFSKYNKLNDAGFKKPFELPQFDNPPAVYAYGLNKTYVMMKDYKILKTNLDIDHMVNSRFAKVLSQDY
ncbi:ABC transporter substrate-binding protein [Desulfobacula sp.]|uniref:ABC transporter substrate-binding protein n=1 Tax=Desulfobacula sp. TaxID=2593537 RepID=UPI00263992C3|nr:ABC transporter substrate-binding protein [Desulfobacula sp.]